MTPAVHSNETRAGTDQADPAGIDRSFRDLTDRVNELLSGPGYDHGPVAAREVRETLGRIGEVPTDPEDRADRVARAIAGLPATEGGAIGPEAAPRPHATLPAETADAPAPEVTAREPALVFDVHNASGASTSGPQHAEAGARRLGSTDGESTDGGRGEPEERRGRERHQRGRGETARQDRQRDWQNRPRRQEADTRGDRLDRLALLYPASAGPPREQPRIRLSEVLPEDQWWLLYIDPAHHATALQKHPGDPGAYYDNDDSQGYKQAMVAAYRGVLDGDEFDIGSFDWDRYDAIKETATTGVSGNFAQTDSGPGGTRARYPLGPGIFKPADDVLAERIGGRPLMSSPEEFLRAEREGEPLPLTVVHVPRRGAGAGQTVVDTMYRAADMPALVNEVIDRFREEISAATTDHERFVAIGRMVRTLNVMHPFVDGNGRLHWHLLLPRLLMEYGYEPLFRNAHDFQAEIRTSLDVLFNGGFSLAQIATALRLGQPQGLSARRLASSPRKIAGVPTGFSPYRDAPLLSTQFTAEEIQDRYPWLTGVNPFFAEGAEFATNCVLTAMYTDRSLEENLQAGPDAEPIFYQVSPTEGSPYAYLRAYRDRDPVPVPDYDAIDEIMTAAGPYARGLVVIGAGQTKIDHVINVVNDKGVVYLDGQLGAEADLPAYPDRLEFLPTSAGFPLETLSEYLSPVRRRLRLGATQDDDGFADDIIPLLDELTVRYPLSTDPTPRRDRVRLSDVLPASDWWQLYLDPTDHEDAFANDPEDPGRYYDDDQSEGFQQALTDAYAQILDRDRLSEEKPFVVSELGWEQYEALHELVTRNTRGTFHRTGDVGENAILGLKALRPAADTLSEVIGGRPLLADPTTYQGDAVPLALLRVDDGEEGEDDPTGDLIITTNYRKAEAPALVDEIFGTFHAEIAAATTDHLRLRAIGRVIRNLHILHPFIDGNRRLNVHLLLPRLLMEYGFEPMIRQDHDFQLQIRFFMGALFNGGYSLDQLATAIRFTQPVDAGHASSLGTSGTPDSVPGGGEPSSGLRRGPVDDAGRGGVVPLSAHIQDDLRYDMSPERWPSGVRVKRSLHGSDGVYFVSHGSDAAVVVKPFSSIMPSSGNVYYADNFIRRIGRVATPRVRAYSTLSREGQALRRILEGAVDNSFVDQKYSHFLVSERISGDTLLDLSAEGIVGFLRDKEVLSAIGRLMVLDAFLGNHDRLLFYGETSTEPNINLGNIMYEPGRGVVAIDNDYEAIALAENDGSWWESHRQRFMQKFEQETFVETLIENFLEGIDEVFGDEAQGELPPWSEVTDEVLDAVREDIATGIRSALSDIGISVLDWKDVFQEEQEALFPEHPVDYHNFSQLARYVHLRFQALDLIGRPQLSSDESVRWLTAISRRSGMTFYYFSSSMASGGSDQRGARVDPGELANKAEQMLLDFSGSSTLPDDFERLERMGATMAELRAVDSVWSRPGFRDRLRITSSTFMSLLQSEFDRLRSARDEIATIFGKYVEGFLNSSYDRDLALLAGTAMAVDELRAVDIAWSWPSVRDRGRVTPETFIGLVQSRLGRLEAVASRLPSMTVNEVAEAAGLLGVPPEYLIFVAHDLSSMYEAGPGHQDMKQPSLQSVQHDLTRRLADVVGAGAVNGSSLRTLLTLSEARSHGLLPWERRQLAGLVRRELENLRLSEARLRPIGGEAIARLGAEFGVAVEDLFIFKEGLIDLHSEAADTDALVRSFGDLLDRYVAAVPIVSDIGSFIRLAKAANVTGTELAEVFVLWGDRKLDFSPQVYDERVAFVQGRVRRSRSAAGQAEPPSSSGIRHRLGEDAYGPVLPVDGSDSMVGGLRKSLEALEREPAGLDPTSSQAQKKTLYLETLRKALAEHTTASAADAPAGASPRRPASIAADTGGGSGRRAGWRKSSKSLDAFCVEVTETGKR